MEVGFLKNVNMSIILVFRCLTIFFSLVVVLQTWIHYTAQDSYATDRLPVNFIEGAAHQAGKILLYSFKYVRVWAFLILVIKDLLRSTQTDSNGLTVARLEEMRIIAKWIDDFESEVFINRAQNLADFTKLQIFLIVFIIYFLY